MMYIKWTRSPIINRDINKRSISALHHTTVTYINFTSQITSHKLWTPKKGYVRYNRLLYHTLIMSLAS